MVGKENRYASLDGRAAPEFRLKAKNLFFLGLIVSSSGIVSPPVALTLGLVFGLSFPHPYAAETPRLTKLLLQASVVLLGFGMDLHEVLKAGRSGFIYTAFSITLVLLAGMALGKLLKVGNTPSFLITAGTAICGGSAIAAVAPIVNADQDEMAVSLGTVFILNSVALLLFPVLGFALHLSQRQFGLWAALAIHDTSSVVGAAARYGAVALVVGTTVKLARALWIVPLALGTAAVKKSGAKVQWPWFILLFCLAAVLSTYLPRFITLWRPLSTLGKQGLAATLFLIGTGLSRRTLKQVGTRPLLQGVILWVIVGVTTLWLILRGVISL